MIKNAMLLVKYLPKVMKLLPQLIQLLESINCAIRGKCGNNFLEANRERTKLDQAVRKGSLEEIIAIRDRLLR